MKTVKSSKSKTTKPVMKAPVKAVAKKAVRKTVAVKAPATIATRKVSVKAKIENAPAQPIIAPRREIASELIAARAYVIWEQQGRPQGNDQANWLLAETQLKQEQNFHGVN